VSTASPLKSAPPALQVLLALLPGLLLSCLLLGWGVLLNLLLAVGTSLYFEWRMLRRHDADVSPRDFVLGATLTGALLALTLPATAPWWLSPLGAAIAVLIGKHLLQDQRLNPAMLGFVVLLLIFPAQMSFAPHTFGADALSSATPLESVRNQLRLQRTYSEIIASLPQAANWAWVSLAWLIGGLYLCWRRVIRWQIPLAVLTGLLLPALWFWAMDADRYASPLFHALSGASMLGAFFIATYPSTRASTPRAQFVSGIAIGLLTYILRTWGRTPEGFAFAVLLVNLATPLMETSRRKTTALLAVMSLSVLLIAPYQWTWSRLTQPALDTALADLLDQSSANNLAANDPVEISDPAFGANTVTVYRARHDGHPVSAIFRLTTAEGYNGDIELLVAINAEGRLMGIRVLHHQETRGFGDPADAQLSGATVTRSAVQRAVQHCLDYFSRHQHDIFATQ
jgi:electron transport complex protein RnfD